MSLHDSHVKIWRRQAHVAQFDKLLQENMAGYVDSDLAQRFAAMAEAAEAARPPSNNMGATPLVVPFPHPDVSPEEVVQKTKIDWLGFSSMFELEAVLLGLQVLWPDLMMTSSKAGMRGYPQCKALCIQGVQYGLVGYGAKHGRLSVSLTGTACKTWSDEQYGLVYEVLQVLDARISRLDICFDFYRGEVTFDDALAAFHAGQFRKKNAPAQPNLRVMGETGPYGENRGRTFYVGPRDGEVYGRVYEKGLEVFAKMPEDYREACTERELACLAAGSERTVADDWLRLEAEFKYKHKDRPIVLEAILQRDRYFAGAYPFFAAALGLGNGLGRGKIKSTNVICHDKLIMAHRASYGNHVHTLRQIGLTSDEICDLLDTGVHNQKLLKAGLVPLEAAAVKRYRQDFDPDFDIPF